MGISATVETSPFHSDKNPNIWSYLKTQKLKDNRKVIPFNLLQPSNVISTSQTCKILTHKAC